MGVVLVKTRCEAINRATGYLGSLGTDTYTCGTSALVGCRHMYGRMEQED
jgi:hypothetical protein